MIEASRGICAADAYTRCMAQILRRTRRHLGARCPILLALACGAVTTLGCDGGEATPKADPPAAKAAPSDTPDAKDTPAPKEASAPTPSTPPAPARVQLDSAQVEALLKVPDSNLSMGDASADGQRLSRLSCAASKMPLMGSIALVGAIAKHKAALDACAPTGDAAVVTWRVDGGKAVDVKVAGTASTATDTCISEAFARTEGAFDATCAAVLLVGAEAGADAAAAALLRT
jgi:hypothetical protein